MAESDYERATARVMAVLEDERLLKSIANSPNRRQSLFAFIEDNFENQTNLKKAIGEKFDTSFKRNFKDQSKFMRDWRGKNINDILDEYKDTQIEKVEFEQKRREERAREQETENRLRSFKERQEFWEKREEESFTKIGKERARRSKVDELKREWNSLSPAARIKLIEEEPQLVDQILGRRIRK